MISITNLILALIAVESGGNQDAIDKSGRCVGVLQITPIFVDDVNEILGRQEFTLEDRRSRLKSIHMARIWFRYHAKPEWNATDYALAFKKGVTGYFEAKGKGTLTDEEHDYAQRVINLMEDTE